MARWHQGPCDICEAPSSPTGATRCMVNVVDSSRRDGKCGRVFLRCEAHGGGKGAVAAVKRHQNRRHPIPALAKEVP